MNYLRISGLCSLLIILNGCAKTPDTKKTPETAKVPASQSKGSEITPEQEAKIQKNLAKLPEADRALAVAQKFCPIQKDRLGLMGKPDRIELDGHVVFLCCSGCEEDAKANPKKTLDQVAEFKKK